MLLAEITTKTKGNKIDTENRCY